MSEMDKKMKEHPPMILTDATSPKGYSLSGKIMLTAIILLFFLVLLMISLHLYARWYLRRARRRHFLRRNLRRRRTNIVFFLDSPTSAAIPSSSSTGLDAALIASLPLFFYHPDSSPENPPECAVCLSEFEPGETGRILPRCSHSFHTDCIDMWFHNHATCPLCRAPVEPQPELEIRPEVVVTVGEPETGSSSVMRREEGENRTGTETGRERRKLSPVTVEVPARSDNSGFGSPSSFRSPVSRMLSLKRMLSREWKGGVSPSFGGGGGEGVGCSSAADLSDAERGGKEETR